MLGGGHGSNGRRVFGIPAPKKKKKKGEHDQLVFILYFNVFNTFKFAWLNFNNDNV
jgi:hypothetical protein